MMATRDSRNVLRFWTWRRNSWAEGIDALFPPFIGEHIGFPVCLPTSSSHSKSSRQSLELGSPKGHIDWPVVDVQDIVSDVVVFDNGGEASTNQEEYDQRFFTDEQSQSITRVKPKDQSKTVTSGRLFSSWTSRGQSERQSLSAAAIELIESNWRKEVEYSYGIFWIQ